MRRFDEGKRNKIAQNVDTSRLFRRGSGDQQNDAAEQNEGADQIGCDDMLYGFDGLADLFRDDVPLPQLMKGKSARPQP